MGGLFYHRVSKDSILFEFAGGAVGCLNTFRWLLYRPIVTDRVGKEKKSK